MNFQTEFRDYRSTPITAEEQAAIDAFLAKKKPTRIPMGVVAQPEVTQTWLEGKKLRHASNIRKAKRQAKFARARAK